MNTYIRWMISTDLDAVMDIELECFAYPWTRAQFCEAMRARNVIGMVAEDTRTLDLHGFFIYALYEHRIELRNFAVHPAVWRNGIGTSIIAKLRGKMCIGGRERLIAKVCETNLSAQLFFQSQGFMCVSTLRGEYEDSDLDMYVFELRCSAELSEPIIVSAGVPADE